jgi:DNA-binding NtrC family response regulator
VSDTDELPELRVRLDDEPRTATRSAVVDGHPPIVYTHCRIKLTSGPDAGKVLETEKDVIRVGSAPDNDLVVQDSAVSRAHLEFRKLGSEFAIVDLGSKNGTYCGTLRIKEATVRERSEIQLGDSVLLMEPLSTEVVIEPSGAGQCGDMVGDSIAMREVFTIIERVAPTELAILVVGETGTGKELVGREVHLHSRRKDGPFVALSLGALPPALIESALFGHERGALEGADDTYAGALERANEGTVFLDDVEQLPLDLQPRLLQAAERGEIQRLGGNRTERVNVRIVLATTADLVASVKSGRFRDDLYYRAIRIDLPPLKERMEDVGPIAESFFERHGDELAGTGAKARRLSAAALGQIQRHGFPGNVRELVNLLRRAAVLAAGEEVLVSDLPAEIAGSKQTRPATKGSALPMPDASVPFKDAKAHILDVFERQYLQDLIHRHRHNISKAAREAGIDRRHLYRLLDKYEIEIKDRPPEE